MKWKYCIFILFLAFCTLLSRAQKITFEDNDPTPIHYKWLGARSKVLTQMGMVYKKPKKFKESSPGEYFEKYPRLESAFTCLSHPLLSRDDQFLAFISIFRPLGSLGLFNIGNPDISHLNQMRAALRSYYGKDVDWQSMLRYYPEDSAKSVFNADTVIRFTITLRPEDYYKKEYKYVDALFLQKNGRGYVNFYCFYTDKAKKNLDYYWKKIEGVLRYEE